MRLVSAHVVNYRSVDDSDSFDVEKDVTCLVGKNESGKTATLRALYRLNPVEPSAKFDEVVDFPAKRSKERKATTGFIPAVLATFELTDDETELVTEHFGPEALTTRFLKLQRGYRTAGTFALDYDEQKMVSHLVAGLDPTSREAIKPTKTIEDFTEALRELSDLPTAANELLTRLDNWGGTAWQCLHSLLSPKLPKFVYFGDYDSMPGKVSIPDLIRRRDTGSLDRGEQALLSLLDMAGAGLEDFLGTNQHEHLVRELENASAGISDEVFEYWSQSKQLAVKLHPFEPEAGAQPPLNEGPILQIRVDNSRHRASVPFDERSRGFVWFFSFLAYFTELEEAAEQDLILLLDEPGLSLHGRAQEDLLRLIDKRLAPKHQVIYTTHSPFMVSADHLQRVRTVIDQDDAGTKVSAEIFKADEDTAFPLYAAMGIEMTQSLFIGEHTLLLEGPSDLIYLDVLSDALTEQGRTGLDPRWVQTPIGGSGKLSTFVTLLGANKIHVAVLVDSSTKDVGAVKRLRDNGQLAKDGLLEISQFTGTKDADIEDLFEPDFYLELVNRAYKQHLTTPITASDLNMNDPRAVRRIEIYFSDHNIANGKFDHYKPAAKLLREQADLVPNIANVTLDRAEQLFTQLNDMLPS
ncbi:energy-coupling factor transporter ATP-binding protein EcfA2 [Crossiella equi]|uniref:Energy-coupling factor transporter ATP-binding protein EcfA2 n=1 Tax=Crossiella equi TaxID=130796 RepID=A0ABS5AMB1_9PSEU|nr:AAA family ATPase [Crossiella equi]MBP2477706.1 energy-coupling factor transporter ATP-binding protein EcfA2 [Crossiella equi]